MTIGSVNGTNAVIQSDAGGSMSIDTLSGSGNRIEVESVESGVTVTHNSSSGLVYQTGGTDADKLGTQQALLAAAEMIGESDEGFETAVADGLVNGSGSAAFDQNGNMIYSSTGESLTMSALKQFSNATLAQWRYETNHLSDRLGEVRRNLGAAGAWARIYGADTDVTDTVTTEIKTNTIQVGGDATVGGNWIVGGAFSYTNMDGTISNGSAEGETYSLAAYASGFFDCGGYIDIIGRIGRLSSDINAYTSTAAFLTEATTIQHLVFPLKLVITGGFLTSSLWNRRQNFPTVWSLVTISQRHQASRSSKTISSRSLVESERALARTSQKRRVISMFRLP